MLNIVLLEPEIPQNTGNISRTCAATGARLHLIEPMGFEVSQRQVKRAGLDYWHLVEVIVYKSLQDFYDRNPGADPWMLSTKAARAYHEVSYRDGDYLMLGKETKGLPEALLSRRYERCIRIPMREEARSLNLSNAAAVVLYEALRQLDFPRLQEAGGLSIEAQQ